MGPTGDLESNLLRDDRHREENESNDA